MKPAPSLVAAIFVCAFFMTLNAQPLCNCDTMSPSICNSQGFEITLVNYGVDAMAGTSFWDYEVCNDKSLIGVCVPPKDLSHIDIDLPSLGLCMTPQQSMVMAQIAGFANAQLGCGVAATDPSCDIFGDPGLDFVAKCDVVGGNLDPGECVVFRLEIAGEQPSLGAGAAFTVTKAGPECGFNCIPGPSCEPCGPPQELSCLTRTAGFWGTHPHITALFLPVTACGEELMRVEAGSCDSATEAMCVSPGRESRRNRAYAQLVRQLTAAQLNLAATAANGGLCDPEIARRIIECESLCGANQSQISSSGCIDDLTAFNESMDTFPITPPPFDSPGPANPSECKKARGNGLVIGAGDCS